MATSVNVINLIAKAEKMIVQANANNKFGIFSFLFSKGNTADLFVQAANIFKVAKEWNKSAETYIKAAEHYLKENSKYEAAINYHNAATLYHKNNDVTSALFYYGTSVALYIDEGKFILASKINQKMASLYEAENNLPLAITLYQTAVDFLETENIHAIDCLIKIAELYIQLEKFILAASVYEKLADESVYGILKYKSKTYLFLAMLCYLVANDMCVIRKKFIKFNPSIPF